ncbi:hypothetical protein WA026_000432 [Henosepilachna vigintioctopunctata]|uniref:ornithine carbamoyltransferase n=1 Tax=Henosepilachna vigintioctopunctata TaxID=420089 RepID=A0AAW1V462_9CUCU
MTHRLLSVITRKYLRYFSSDVKPEKYPHSLIGRRYLEPTDFTDEELKSLIWTANEFKSISNDEYNHNNLENKSITFLLSAPDIHFQCALYNASKFLGLPVKVVVDPKWESWQFPEDVGRILGKTCDVIFLLSFYHSKALALAAGASVPVIVISDKRFANLRTLSDIFTIREHFGYLENLTISWVGSPTQLINTYLLTMPRFGMKLKYFCCHLYGERVSPVTAHAARNLGKPFKDNCQEASCFDDALKQSKILVMGNNLGGLKQINEQNCKAADHNFYIFHNMPRTEFEICSEIFQSKRNLTWPSYRNYEWLLAAFIVRSLVDYKHITKAPNFAEIKNVK